MKRPFRKYVFNTGYKAKHPVGSFSKQEDMAMYHELKKNTDIELYKEKGLALNVINAKWIFDWQNFTKGLPGS